MCVFYNTIFSQVEAIAGGMYENIKVNMNITMGNIPLPISQDAHLFGYPIQSSNQINPTNIQLPPIYIQPIDFNESTPVTGFALQVPPYGLPSCPQQSMVPAQNIIPYVQPSLYPQPQVYNQSQLPDVNIQQPAFNPDYQNLNSEINPSAPIAPSF